MQFNPSNKLAGVKANTNLGNDEARNLYYQNKRYFRHVASKALFLQSNKFRNFFS